MAETLTIRRPLDGFTAAAPLGLAAAPPMARFVLRGRDEALAAAEVALGFALPHQACRAAGAGERHALWLGPDEWLLLAPAGQAESLSAALEQAMDGLPHALVEVSQRQTGLVVTGALAETLLSVGCPLDLAPAAFPVGMCTRTVMAKVEVVLWRTGSDAFHIEVWRSFAAYAWRFLEAAGAEFVGG
ncbi:sarcosine oxidase subunit gamma [Phenylobacterium montanum]|uniref:Sarcosine oxidase subunit gamma family protein n=1 Tax=Phenylobacterium montanum TaxID=2823693 RepID=A0A975G227_9CAUL|nr:sarcosine oxidase subunit gamma family protein [Caulobacter sp. S6]QUD89067.1 sarcosine oxidase subunit gamma family protein [Caulobacter sp. S6]